MEPISGVIRMLRACAKGKTDEFNPHWADTSRTTMSWAADIIEAANEVSKENVSLRQQVTLLNGRFSREEELTATINNLQQQLEAERVKVARLRAAIKANHDWRIEYDEYGDGYQMCETNTNALSESADNDAWMREQKAKALEVVKPRLMSIADGYNSKTEYGEGRIDSVHLMLDDLDEMAAGLRMQPREDTERN